MSTNIRPMSSTSHSFHAKDKGGLVTIEQPESFVCGNDALFSLPTVELCSERLSHALPHPFAKLYGNRKTIASTAECLSAANQFRVIQFIESHLGEDISVVTLAGKVGLSPAHFSRCFTASIGKSPHRYVLQRRIEAALRILAISSCPITEIAMSLGFNSHSHFTQIFRQYTGMTPTHARSLKTMNKTFTDAPSATKSDSPRQASSCPSRRIPLTYRPDDAS